MTGVIINVNGYSIQTSIEICIMTHSPFYNSIEGTPKCSLKFLSMVITNKLPSIYIFKFEVRVQLLVQ